MIGAITGDILGSVHERIPNVDKRTVMCPTDDTWLTCAALQWVHKINKEQLFNNFDSYKLTLINEAKKSLRYFWSFEKDSGFSKRFSAWASNIDAPQGIGRTNGSLMRQSPIIQWSVDNHISLEVCLDLCDVFASVTHHHHDTYPAIQSHAELLFHIMTQNFNLHDAQAYILDSNYKPSTIDYWKAQKAFIWDAPKSLSIVYCAILNANDFKQFIDNCIEIGGDVDTYCAIGGPIAQALWGIPNDYLRLTDSILSQSPYEPIKSILVQHLAPFHH